MKKTDNTQVEDKSDISNLQGGGKSNEDKSDKAAGKKGAENEKTKRKRLLQQNLLERK